LDRGYFQVREGTRINHLGRDQAFTRTYFTGKGIVWIQKRWDDRLATLKATGCRS
jgi:phage antirepressor YoqD-like protein